VSSRGASTPHFYIQVNEVIKKCNRVSYNVILISTISLLIYFTYIIIDIIIYALRRTWSSGIFWMVGRVVADPSLSLLSPYKMVPRVLILVDSPPVFDK
jgi:hypothetical protein